MAGWGSDIFGGGGDFLSTLGTALLGAIATGVITHGLNRAIGPKQPTQRDVYRDIQMQQQAGLQGQKASAEIQRGFTEPIRTPEQIESDRMVLEASRQRAQAFQGLSQEYASLKARGPIWDPYEESRIRQESMGEAAARGMADSGQAQEHVRQRLEESRIRRAGLHQEALSNLRQQMLPYTGIQPPGQPPLFSPGIPPGPMIAAQPRRIEPMFRAAPFDIGAALLPETKKLAQKAVGYTPSYTPTPSDYEPWTG